MRVLLLILVGSLPLSAQQENLRVYPEGQQPDDVRLKPQKDLNGHFPFAVPESMGEWEGRRAELQRRICVATGICPMPERTPLNAVVHGKVKRDGFTVEKVYFQSVPNHFVTGLLFRPDKPGSNRPAVLSPHGHGGRMQDYGEKKIQELIKDGAETFEASGRFPKIARCAQLARMGCVVFIYDMLGYVDSQQISYELAHRFAKQRPEFESKDNWGFYSTQAELRLQSIMGLQTWNSIRALDFLCGLDDVDPKRVAVTGGSGGGTQTILLCAIDDRPVAAFPQGMVSTSMQGGCTCENCSLLRIGTGNVELAALFAPKPQAMTAAKDWTVAMMNDGFPELQRLYAMYDKEEFVDCKPYLHFPHNYNAVTRRDMYAWFNKHLNLGVKEPIEERDYPPLSKEEYSVWNDQHPQPKAGADYERRLLSQLAKADARALEKVQPTDENSLAEYRHVVGGAWETIINRQRPVGDDVQRTMVSKENQADHILFKDILRLTSRDEEFPIISLYPTATEWNKSVAIWIDGVGKQGLFTESGAVRNEVQRLLDGGYSVVSPDLFLQGEFLSDDKPLSQTPVVKNPREFAGYTFGYNDTVFVQRVHDLLTLAGWVKDDDHKPQEVIAIGVNGGAPVLAAALATEPALFDRVAIDADAFRFANLTSYRDPNFVPGAVKYGDLPGLLSLAAPTPLWIGDESEIPGIVKATYAAAGKADQVTVSDRQDSTSAGVSWLLGD